MNSHLAYFAFGFMTGIGFCIVAAIIVTKLPGFPEDDEI